ncbi:wall-associated receptor kinase-like 2 isoform X2 [Silene latifolia]|uniref:wall-associated receptor kinase-like 2 isoform X2 n=1 Tax=Silene latifolia TaxID=37657 RepID=UPI003D76F454
MKDREEELGSKRVGSYRIRVSSVHVGSSTGGKSGRNISRITVSSSISKPDCVDHCGDVKIPYPFGIGADCYYNRSYEIICNTSSDFPKPLLGQFNLEVLNIGWPGGFSIIGRENSYFDSCSTTQLLEVVVPPQNLCGSSGSNKIQSYDLKGSPYLFSIPDNYLIMVGCGSRATLKTRSGEILASCNSVCVGNDFNSNGSNETTCEGDGCCKDNLSNSLWNDDLDFYEIDVNFEKLMNHNTCDASVAFVDIGSNFSGSLSNLTIFPTTLCWKAPSFPRWCSDGYSCLCPFPYEGNPYLPDGCHVPQECQKCKNNCQRDYKSNSTVGFSYYCKPKAKRPLLRRAAFLAFFIGVGVVLLALGSYWLYRFVKWIREIKQKAKHFKQNGGLLLEQQMSSNEGVVETTKVFSITELEKATDNFNDNRILGQGGQGMVYKGMLMDGKIVAIKTAKKVDESQVEQFINEVVVLSQINHRNVVKLLGCCFETEVPILVYEFIPNGTLYELIHDQGQEFYLNWKMRLQIAAESAGAVAYLHSSSSAPIYHRDIKSTNILLDEKYRAKVSDFGTSKAINIDQTHVTTVVLGTYGYLDPEYFQSNQFTEKSDVYSFGVVLVELITGKKPICPTENGGWINLATEFLTTMEEARVLDMLDARIINEGKEDEFMAIAEIARKCLNMNGKQRPTMKEIAVQLDGIRSSHIPIIRELGHVNRNQRVTVKLIYA